MNSVLQIGENIMFIYQGKNHWVGTKNEILNADNKELYNFVFASEFMQQVFKASKL